jgi:hypothetical protein
MNFTRNFTRGVSGPVGWFSTLMAYTSRVSGTLLLYHIRRPGGVV